MSGRFGRRYDMPRLTPEQATRQGAASTMAFELLGGRDAAVAFLNETDEALGGRPLDVAIASEEGLEAVERKLKERAGEAA